MKISQVITSIDNSSGGTACSATHLLSAMGKESPNIDFHLHTFNSNDPIIKRFEEENVSLTFYNRKSFERFDCLEISLRNSQTSIFHGQGIWELPIHQMVKLARKLKTPYIITPHGMLERWSLQQRKFKKKLALKLYQFSDLANASCIHVTAEMEADSVRALGFKNPIAVIPNGVPLEDFPIKKFDNSRASKKILFLSRIHYKKGIEYLIEAWSKISPEVRSGWNIDIIGNGNPSYINRLEAYICSKDLENSIQIKKPVYGANKNEAYQEADLFVLPTHSENFGIVVAEALACGTPVITTKGAPWEDLITNNCGWWIETGVDPLIDALNKSMTQPRDILQEMGHNGRLLVEEKYSMQAVAKQMLSLYNWILNKDNEPTFLRLKD